MTCAGVGWRSASTGRISSVGTLTDAGADAEYGRPAGGVEVDERSAPSLRQNRAPTGFLAPHLGHRIAPESWTSDESLLVLVLSAGMALTSPVADDSSPSTNL